MFKSQSFQDYREIFNQRGQQYHQAMAAQPHARRAEFERIVALADLQSGHYIADIPSGGGYLRAFLPDDVRLLAIETASAFLQPGTSSAPQPVTPHTEGISGENAARDTQLLCADLRHIPLASGSFDRVLSLAGAHHLPDAAAFYDEVFRLLKPGGSFILADVQKGSRIDEFLNQWVHAHNTLGHQGTFLDDSTLASLQTSGFQINSAAPQTYRWEFPSEAEIIHYCRFLFGLDLADDAQIGDALRTILDAGTDDSGAYLNWELLFISAIIVDEST